MDDMRTSTETLEDRIVNLETAMVDLTAKYNRLISSLDEFGNLELDNF